MFKNCMLFSLVALLINNGVNAQANRYDVVIDEIMADPTPQVGLPTNEWIEIKNTSQQAFDLKGWRIGDASGQSGAMPPSRWIWEVVVRPLLATTRRTKRLPICSSAISKPATKRCGAP